MFACRVSGFGWAFTALVLGGCSVRPLEPFGTASIAGADAAVDLDDEQDASAADRPATEGDDGPDDVGGSDVATDLATDIPTDTAKAWTDGGSDTPAPLLDGGAEHPSPGLRVQYQNPGLAKTWVGISTAIVNDSTTPVNLASVTMKYWMARDQGVTFSCQFSSVGCDKTSLSVRRRGQLLYLGVEFSAAAGALAPGGGYLVQLNGHRSDFGILEQDKDYSYEPDAAALADDPAITLYIDEQLVWGTEPPQ